MSTQQHKACWTNLMVAPGQGGELVVAENHGLWSH